MEDEKKIMEQLYPQILKSSRIFVDKTDKH